MSKREPVRQRRTRTARELAETAHDDLATLTAELRERVGALEAARDE